MVSSQNIQSTLTKGYVCGKSDPDELVEYIVMRFMVTLSVQYRVTSTATGASVTNVLTEKSTAITIGLHKDE